MEELYRRFGGPLRKNFIKEFTKLSQTCIIFDYLEKFEYLRSLMDIDNPTLSENFFISTFISGLNP